MKRTELKRGTSQLKSTKRMKQKRATPRRQTRDETIAEAGAENDWSPETRRIIRLRSGGMCELKCNRIATEMHHRKLRGHGDHRPENGLHVCDQHHDWIHGGWVHDKRVDDQGEPYDPYRLGWLVRSTLDPALVKVEMMPFGVPT
jgi:hypothetical protein